MHETQHGLGFERSAGLLIMNHVIGWARIRGAQNFGGPIPSHISHMPIDGPNLVRAATSLADVCVHTTYIQEVEWDKPPPATHALPSALKSLVKPPESSIK
jgi:hypothetical protein